MKFIPNRRRVIWMHEGPRGRFVFSAHLGAAILCWVTCVWSNFSIIYRKTGGKASGLFTDQGRERSLYIISWFKRPGCVCACHIYGRARRRQIGLRDVSLVPHACEKTLKTHTARGAGARHWTLNPKVARRRSIISNFPICARERFLKSESCKPN